MNANQFNQRESFQTKFNDLVNQIYNEISEFQKSKLSGIKGKNIEEYFIKVKSHISKGLKEIKSEMERLMNDIEWNEYNIAFFGETNSGKSTIIEALTSGNGKSIGDGRKDYTQNVSALDYDGVTLLDMPGIEGNESKYKKEIEKAVNKSHVIFYIIGTNKEPEEKTINKISNYLRATAKVYSILNIRGKSSVFKYKKELIGKNENVIIERTNHKFITLFNNHYVGNIAINGYISFLSGFNITESNKFINEIVSVLNNIGNFIFKKIFRKKNDIKLGRQFTYAKEKEDLLNIFGNVETAYNYSNIQKLKEVLKTLSDNSPAEIYSANSYKVTTILNSLKQNLINENNNLKQVIKDIKSGSLNTKKNGEYLFDVYKEEFISSSNLHLTKLETHLLKKAYEGIDNEWDKEVIEQKMEIIANKFKSDMERNYKNLKTQFQKEFLKLEIELKNRLLLNFSNSLDYDQNFKNILKDLPSGFIQDLIHWGGFSISITGILLAFETHWILGILAFIAALILNTLSLFRSEEKKKQNKKDKARENIKEGVNKKKIEVRQKIITSFSQYENRFIDILNKSINDLEDDFDIFDNKFKDFTKSISKYNDIIKNINK